MFCWKCGREISEEAAFCPGCGAAQKEMPGKKKTPDKLLVLVICLVICTIAAVAALLGVAGMLFGSQQENRSDQEVVEAVRTAAENTPAETEATGETAAAETEPPTEETEAPTEPPVDPQSVELPDLSDFLDTKFTQDVWGYTHYVTCLVDNSDEVFQSILDLLLEDRYQLELEDSWTYRDGSADCTDYIYRYTGTNGEIDWVEHKQGYRYHVKLTRMEYDGKDEMAVVMYTHPEFHLKDPGQQAGTGNDTQEEADSEDTGYDPFNRPDCYYCGGDGRCNNCGGSGHVMQYMAGTRNYVQVNCTQCNFGSCRPCGGSGKR